jgi:hypothetical protein
MSDGSTTTVSTMTLPRALVTFVALMTLIGSNAADWNATHIFSELWSPHARFHGVWFVSTVSLLSLLSLWLAWSRRGQSERLRLAIMVQACIWLAFFPAALTPHTLFADPGKEVELAGTDLNLIGAVLNVALLALGLLLMRQSRQRPD